MYRIRAVMLGLLLLVAALPANAGAPLAVQLPGLPDLVETLLPAVVNITILKQQPPPNGRVPQGGEDLSLPVQEIGSGFIIDPDGYIVTNRHVVAEAYKVTVRLHDGTPYPATVLATNERPDLALLKIKADHPLPTVPLGNSEALRIGQTVIAIGNPFGLSSSISVGVVSALNRNVEQTQIDDFVQTDAAINHGNSGGPLFNLQGEVVGVNWALVEWEKGAGSIGLGLAIPSNDVAFVVDHMRRYGRLRAGFVGVRLQEITPELAGALGLSGTTGGIVASVWPTGPAAKAGLREGDVVLQFGARRTTDVRALLRAMGTNLPGTTAPLTFWRDGQVSTVPVNVAEWPKEVEMYDPAGAPVMPNRGRRMTSPDLGLHMAAITDALRQEHGLAPTQAGVLVLGVAANSIAADIGMAPGDVIVRVQENKVATPGEVLQNLDALRQQGRRAAVLLVQSPSRPHWVPAPLSDF